MISIVTPETMRNLENAVIEGGVTEIELIVRAAQKMAACIDDLVPEQKREKRHVVAVAGPGNNGVDAVVAAGLLCQWGWNATVVLVERDTIEGVPLASELIERIALSSEIPPCDVILDGIYGNSGRTELSGKVTDVLASMSEAAASSSAYIVAIDCPTGINCNTGIVADAVVRADVTLCVSNPKIGMLRSPANEYLGELEMIDIGVRTPELDSAVNASMIDADFVRTRIIKRNATAHKSDVGGVLVVGGAPGYFGAPRLAGESALRTGAGYVGLAVPRSITSAIASAVPELIFHPTSDSDGRHSARTVREALESGDRYQAVVIGPGLGRDDVASDLLSTLLSEPSKVNEAPAAESAFGIPRRVEARPAGSTQTVLSYPLVIDADALNWLSKEDEWHTRLQSNSCVLTPHAGELARLLDVDIDTIRQDPWDVVREAATRWEQVVVLKYALTCVATPEGELYTAPRLTPELATPGTGDVLAGMIGCLLAQGHSPADASAIGIYVGAIAGKFSARRYGTRSVVTRDIIAELGNVLRTIDTPWADSRD